MKYIYLFGFIIICLNSYTQDIIFLKNGDEIKSKVLEITTSEVKYKKFSNQNGPTYTLLKTDIFKIKYPNGDQDIFKDDASKKTEVKSNNENSVTDGSVSDSKKDNNVNEVPIDNPLFPSTSKTESQESEINSQQQSNNLFNYQPAKTFEVLHSDLQKINSDSNKEEIKKLVLQLEEAVLRDDMKKAWEIQAEIDKLN